MRYFIANWKANKNLAETVEWIEEFKQLTDSRINELAEKATVIVCPPYPLILPVEEALKDMPNVFIGAQNVSSLPEGAHTGEVPARSLKGLVDFVIVGHSERRDRGESNADIALKITELEKHDLKPILCVRDENDEISPGLEFIAYEPVAAIGTGKNEDLEKVLDMKRRLSLPPQAKFIYGGSVNNDNIKEYLKSDEINGFLIATASFSASSFFKILTQA